MGAINRLMTAVDHFDDADHRMKQYLEGLDFDQLLAVAEFITLLADRPSKEQKQPA